MKHKLKFYITKVTKRNMTNQKKTTKNCQTLDFGTLEATGETFAEYFQQNTNENEWKTRSFSVTAEIIPENLSGLKQETVKH
jgi:hypothetical protein